MSLRFYNTKTRAKDDFAPLDPHNVRMYVCGPTVYDFAHIGNARPAVVFDVLFRLLRHVYGADHVTYARNITDVEDKIIERAAREGRSIEDLTNQTTKQYQDDMAALGALPPTVEPRATGHIAEMQDIIAALIDNGLAYEAEGHVLYDVAAKKDYGSLSNRSIDDMIAGARVEVAPYKKNPMDFVLWKPSSEDMPGWASPWGYGRPGWHIECSAMSHKHLGEHFDIHGGGRDLIFPHHENEVAQSTGAFGGNFVSVWMHNGYLTVEGEKMSKSLGNFFTAHDLLADHSGEAIRLAMLSTHYRQPLDWTAQGVHDAKTVLDRWYRQVDNVTASEVPQGVLDALGDDLNTPGAIAALHQEKDPAALKAGANLLGLLEGSAEDWFHGGGDVDAAAIDALVAERTQAKADKDFARADEIRDQLAAQNIILEDGPGGTSWRKE